MAEPRRDRVDRDDGDEIDDKNSAQVSRALQTPGQREHHDAEGDRLHGLRRGEPECADRKQVHRDELRRRRNRDRDRRHDGAPQPKYGIAPDRDPGQDDDQQDERDRARGEGEEDQRRCRPAPSGLQREQAEQREQDAERERKLGHQDDSRPDEGEAAARPARRRSPLPFEQAGERAGCERDVSTESTPMPRSAASG